MLTSLGITSLTGCGEKFEYQIEENGIVSVEGNEEFDEFKKIKLVHLTNEIANLDEYYLASCHVIINPGEDTIEYINIETGRIIYITTDDDYQNFKIEVVVDFMVDYLYKYDMVKDNYTINDVITLKENLLNDETVISVEKTNKRTLSK